MKGKARTSLLGRAKVLLLLLGLVIAAWAGSGVPRAFWYYPAVHVYVQLPKLKYDPKKGGAYLPLVRYWGDRVSEKKLVKLWEDSG